ncbi:variable large family protein [Borrelia crocidurae]|uniref:Variable large protein n=1 Tax=Borrelia crocidurae (strain Achema) TaxID=1155096 RepID=I0FEL8_BORCA|nr:variable large family protein [Borrelia crocidurae]AFI31924.1 Vlp protein, alpha subfamily [Borrelia crocidurae str. Achema]
MKIEKKAEGKIRVIILMMVMMVMGCNSGGVEGEGQVEAKSLSEVLMEVGRSAGDAFYSFLELVSGSLGFSVTKETKKEDVGKYFNSLGEKIGVASEELEKVAVKASADVDKEGVLINKAIRAAVDSAKTTLKGLKGHLESLKGIGDGTVVGEANNAEGEGTAPDDAQLKAMFNGLKGIVEIAIEEGVAKPEAGNTAVKVGNANNKDGAKILSTHNGNNPAAADAGKAAAILTTVSGKEILGAIVQSGESDLALSSAASGATTAMSFARGNNGDHLAQDTAKAAAVAGGIALRALVKTSKLAAGGNSDAQGGGKEVQGVGISAVNKLLVAVGDMIKKTVKNVLEKVKQEVDKARDPKAVSQQ